MKLKIYQPYLISEDTITHYQVESNINVSVKLEKFSLKDILEAQFLLQDVKLYFKVEIFEEFGNSSIFRKSSKMSKKMFTDALVFGSVQMPIYK